MIGAGAVFGQPHEVGLTLGRIAGITRSAPGADLNLDSGVALQANYSYRVLLKRHIAVSAEIHMLANGQREVRSLNTSATRDVATLYVTPGLRFKFAPIRHVSPWVTAGGGYALYEQSFFRIDGADNTSGRFVHRGVLMFGGGGDFPLWRWIGGRVEVRDFYSGNPGLNTPLYTSGQHNVVFSGGFVLFVGRGER
jgi:hypothetical protein